MKIEVDTKGDSREEIMHAIKLLKAAIGETSLDEEIKKETFSNEPEENDIETLPEAGFMNIFSDNSIKEKETFVNDDNEQSLNENSDIDKESITSNNLDNNLDFFDLSSINESQKSNEEEDNIEQNTESQTKDNDIKNNIIETKKEEIELDTFDSFYKEFNDNEEEKEETFSNQEKPKKKLFNIEFY